MDFTYRILTLPAISLSCGCAESMTLWAFVVVDALVRAVVVVVVVESNVGLTGCNGFNGRTFNVGDGELLAWPFLLFVDGLLGLRGITSS